MAKEFLFWWAVGSTIIFIAYVAIALIGNKKWEKYEDEHSTWFLADKKEVSDE